MVYILLLPLLILGAFCLIRELRSRKRRGLTPAQICALVFWAFTLLSAALSSIEEGNPWYDEKSHEAAVTISLYVLLFLIVSRWGAVSERVFKVLFWSLVVFALISYLQLLGANPLKLYPGDLNYYTASDKVGRTGTHLGTIGNVDIVSAFLALTAPMLLLHTRGQKPRKAWPCWVLAAACVGVMGFIKVLCGLVGLVMGALICLPVLCPDKWRKWILLSYGVLGLGALVLFWLVDLPVGFFHELHEMLHGRFEDSFGTGRIYIWKQMLERIPQRIWTGVGPDMTRYSGLSPFVRFDEAGKEVARTRITDAHCYPLQILYCQGLPALLSWLGVVGFTLYHWGKHRRDRAVAILGGGLVCFLCAMLFCISSVIIMSYFWLTLGLLEARAAALREEAG
jgi:O-antigen ligase